MNRYEFLTALHAIVGTRRYLEIGVQTGASLTCADSAETIVGVDPDLGNLQYQPKHAVLIEATSDDFFASEPEFIGPDGQSWLDVVFIDGLHHSDQVWKDLANASRLGHPKTLYVLDDVLPRNDGEASRQMCPGDWTGDVWKVLSPAAVSLEDKHPNFFFTVDTFPTGVAVFGGIFASEGMDEMLPLLMPEFLSEREVPASIKSREDSLSPSEALEEVASWIKS